MVPSTTAALGENVPALPPDSLHAMAIIAKEFGYTVDELRRL
jgi:hypothetical protein